MAVNAGGTGHQLVFPYFTTQGDNATSIALVNTDTSAGKVLKVRFRSAVNSDDVLDFQVLMSPGDVWTAAITAGTDGKSRLTTSDTTCTIPDSVRKGVTVFDTSRVDPKATDVNAQTREGYIEVINMADIPVGSALFTATKHTKGTPLCTEATFVSALTSRASAPTANLAAPTGRVGGDFIIVQQTNRAAWSGSATALVSRADGSPAQVAFWPQDNVAIASGASGADGTLTTDPLLTVSPTTALTDGRVVMRNYDLPDLSTPYGVNADGTNITLSGNQLASTVSALRTVININQFETSAGIGGLTDLVLTQPTRRYHAAVNYVSGAAAYAPSGTVSSFVNSLSAANSALVNRILCLNKAELGTVATGTSGSGMIWDREENQPLTNPTYFVLSPSTVPVTVYNLCGEVSVTSINSATSSALNANLTRASVVYPAGYESGWIMLDTTAYGGLPFINNAFVRASTPGQNYGFTFGNKTRAAR